MKLIIATAIACLVSGAACAEERVVVSYSDVNLATTNGAGALYRRIVNASETVCRQESVLGVHGAQWLGCVHAAVAQAVSDVDSPLLTARHHRDATGRLYSARAATPK